MAVSTILLVNPNRMRPPIAPLGLEYVAAGLRRGGYAPVLCDLTWAEDWPSALENAIAETQPKAAVFSIRNLDDAYFASQDFILERTAEIIRHARQHTSSPIILGGVGFSISPEAVLAFTGADYGIAGDGEASLPALLDALIAGESVQSVPGAVFRTDNGGVAANAPAIWDPATAPAPSRRFLDHPRYFAEGGQAGIETKRGCSNRCIYCVEPHAKGGCVRVRPPESVVEEMKDLLEQGVDVYHLCDSEFTLPMDHARAVCAAIERSGIAPRIRWYTYAYPKPFDAELAQAMARAGCVGINFGVDHTVPAIIRGFGRDYGLEDLRQTAEACRAAGLAVMFDMLLGGPGETRETLARAIEDIRTLPLDRIGLSCGARVYPNTPLAQLVLQQGPVESNPNLHGVVKGNDNFLRPIFYVEENIGVAVHRVVSELVAGDARFLHTDPAQIDGNYNYNDNSVLSDAIRNGARGAYWDILRKLHQNK